MVVLFNKEKTTKKKNSDSEQLEILKKKLELQKERGLKIKKNKTFGDFAIFLSKKHSQVLKNYFFKQGKHMRVNKFCF